MGQSVLVKAIFEKLSLEKDQLKTEFNTYEINSCVVDDLLSEDVASNISNSFPSESEMTPRMSIRERKYVSADMDVHAEIIKAITFAFQDRSIVNLLSEITGIESITADENLYAGGISSMTSWMFFKSTPR